MCFWKSRVFTYSYALDETGKTATVASPPFRNLLTIARIKVEAAFNQTTSVEISGQRLIV